MLEELPLAFCGLGWRDTSMLRADKRRIVTRPARRSSVAFSNAANAERPESRLPNPNG